VFFHFLIEQRPVNTQQRSGANLVVAGVFQRSDDHRFFRIGPNLANGSNADGCWFLILWKSM
jgi:hypothetical protein